MKTALLSLVLFFYISNPATASIKDDHPKIHKAWRLGTAPVRYTYKGCVWVGKKSKPLMPFFELCAFVGNTVTPVIVSFKK